MEALSELVAAMGVDRPDRLGPHHVSKRNGPSDIKTSRQAYRFLQSGALLAGSSGHPIFDRSWALASAETFGRVEGFTD
jgi:hypothetical protein